MQNLPLIVLGFFGFTAGFMSLLLPETLFSPMPQTVSQVEEWDEDYSLPCRRQNTRKECIVKEDALHDGNDQGSTQLFETTI